MADRIPRFRGRDHGTIVKGDDFEPIDAEYHGNWRFLATAFASTLDRRQNRDELMSHGHFNSTRINLGGGLLWGSRLCSRVGGWRRSNV